MRLDKFLALQGLGSRNEVRALLRAGRVCVAGNPVRDAGFSFDPEAALVTLDGEAIAYQSALHIMMNKPDGILTAARDPRRRTVMDLLPRRMAAMDCMPIGRLDLDTEGLLLFSTDGELAHRLLSPRRHVDKVYEAAVDTPLDGADVDAFAAGVPLSDFTAMPARLDIAEGDALCALVTVQEGKFHQVKRMFLARGKTVLRLKRLSFGGVALDPSLGAGEWRELSPQELALLEEAAGGGGHG